MIPENKKWSDESISVSDCKMQNSEYIDLSQVWHDASEMPKEEEWILLQFGGDCYDTLVLGMYADIFRARCKKYGDIRWAYISDLLPKGGEK